MQRTRETFTFFKEKIGNTKTILRVVDYWYSPALGINVKVVRHDPRDGDQTLWLTNISTTAADPHLPGPCRLSGLRPPNSEARYQARRPRSSKNVVRSYLFAVSNSPIPLLRSLFTVFTQQNPETQKA